MWPHHSKGRWLYLDFWSTTFHSGLLGMQCGSSREMKPLRKPRPSLRPGRERWAGTSCLWASDWLGWWEVSFQWRWLSQKMGRWVESRKNRDGLRVLHAFHPPPLPSKTRCPHAWYTASSEHCFRDTRVGPRAQTQSCPYQDFPKI